MVSDMDGRTREQLLNIAGGRSYDPDHLHAKYVKERDRRVVAAGNAQFMPTDGAFESFGKDPWASPDFKRDPITDHTDVIIAGGGFGGLLAGARLREAGCTDIRIIESAGGFGGTWYWNRYPGAMCDLEAHIYLPLIEELQYTPRHRYAYAPEMLEVSDLAARHYNLYNKACFQTVITSARWIEDEQKWLIETDRDDRMTANVLILACGRQSLPKLPGIEGIDTFKGHAFHSSRWDYAYTGGDFYGGMTGLADKRVAVIGTGATALQLVPEVAKDAKELLVFQRTPSSAGVRDQRETGAEYCDMTTPGWQRERRYNFQSVISRLPVDEDEVRDGWTLLTKMSTPPTPTQVTQALGRHPTKEELGYLAEIYDYDVMNSIRDRVREIVEDAETAEALKPWYRWFCKRPGFHDDYLAAFNRPNVRLIDTAGHGVERITERGIVVNGEEYPVDCLIFATGFEAGIGYTRLTGFELYGRDGIPLSEHWSKGVRTLHGFTTDRFPNLFLMGGNQQTGSAVNAVHLLDEQAEHIAYIWKTMAGRSIAEVEPTADAVDDYVALIRSSPANGELVKFYAQCTPGYYNAEGKATKSEDLFFGGRYGEGPIPYFKMLQAWRDAGTLEGLVRDREAADVDTGGFISNIVT